MAKLAKLIVQHQSSRRSGAVGTALEYCGRREVDKRRGNLGRTDGCNVKKEKRRQPEPERFKYSTTRQRYAKAPS